MAARKQRLDFEAINRAGLASLSALLRRWLPDGRLLRVPVAVMERKVGEADGT